MDGYERMALENEKRAVEREREMTLNEIALRGGGHNESTWHLQTRLRSLEARLQTIDAQLRRG
jgi:hypothetical protein